MDHGLRLSYAQNLVDSGDTCRLNGPNYSLLLTMRNGDLVLSAIPNNEVGKLYTISDGKSLIKALTKAFDFLGQDTEMVDDILSHWQSYDEYEE